MRKPLRAERLRGTGSRTWWEQTDAAHGIQNARLECVPKSGNRFSDQARVKTKAWSADLIPSDRITLQSFITSIVAWGEKLVRGWTTASGVWGKG